MPIFDDCGTLDGEPVILEQSMRTCVRQRLFGSVWERENQRNNYIFLAMRAKDLDQILVWVAQMLLLCQLSSPTALKFGE